MAKVQLSLLYHEIVTVEVKFGNYYLHRQIRIVFVFSTGLYLTVHLISDKRVVIFFVQSRLVANR